MFKKIKITIFSFLFSLILLSTLINAQVDEIYHLKLLAVEGEDNFQGSDADLYLELKEGTGRVFLDTFPLTKLDTQISTRFAKELACKHFKIDCDQYDFIYTIKAKSNIIGGPSAGAAIAALTTIATLNLDYNSDISITGTINSGGIIGPVGGIKEKLEAASNFGLKKVMISQGASMHKLKEKKNESKISIEDNEKNQSKIKDSKKNETKLNLIEYGKNNLSLEVIEVISLDDVIFHLTGVNLNDKKAEITVNEDYNEIMNGLQKVLCDRTKQIETKIIKENLILNETITKIINQRKGKSINSTEKKDFYSAASFCFSNNIQLKSSFYIKKNYSKEKIDNQFLKLKKKTDALIKKLEQEEIETISDLQTFMVVKERTNDVYEQLKKYKEKNYTIEESSNILGYSEERFFAALSWMQFFVMDGKKFVFNEELLRNSCLQKISESEERRQYANLYLPDNYIEGIKEKIDTSRKALDEKEYELCLITAAQAKADANAVLSSIGLEEDNIEKFLESKRKAVEIVISENSAENIFPILGYSYYKYAQALQKQEKFTSLVYIEYALEMSDLGMYFPEEQKFLQKFARKTHFIKKELILLIAGFLIGMISTLLIIKLKKKKVQIRREDYLK